LIQLRVDEDRAQRYANRRIFSQASKRKYEQTDCEQTTWNHDKTSSLNDHRSLPSHDTCVQAARWSDGYYMPPDLLTHP
jgi:hypothetical protein